MHGPQLRWLKGRLVVSAPVLWPPDAKRRLIGKDPDVASLPAWTPLHLGAAVGPSQEADLLVFKGLED